MKRRFLGFLFVLMLLFYPISVNAQNPIKLWINGNFVETDVPPIIENNRTLVPIRVISESLGCKVDWIPESQSVKIYHYDENTGRVDKAFFMNINVPTIFDINLEYFNSKISSAGLSFKDLDLNTINFDDIKLNVIEKPLDAAPVIRNNRTMVPIRAISEQLGVYVDWDPTNRTAIVGEGYVVPYQNTLNRFVDVPNPDSTQSNQGNANAQGGWRDPHDPAYKYAEGKIIANKNSGIYHRPGQTGYKKVALKNAIFYNTAAEAQAAGFRAAKN